MCSGSRPPLAVLLLAAVLLTACSTGATPTAPAAGAPATPAEPASSGLRRVSVYEFSGYDGRVPRPLYDSVPADRPSLVRIAALLGAAQWNADPQLGHFPVARPHGGISMTIVRADGKVFQVSEAFRCPVPNDINQCKLADGFVMVDDHPAFAPALADYLYHGGWRGEMPRVEQMTLIEPKVEGNEIDLKPGASIAVQGEAATEDPLQLKLIWGQQQGKGAPPPPVLATLPAPGGSWSWRGVLPADLAPGEYALCAGNGACLNRRLVVVHG